MTKIIQYGDIKDDTHIGELCEHLQEAIRNMSCDCGYDHDENVDNKSNREGA
jgi:hypothetical protein|tara:strand:- start:196 stop:351 length:156 start_codon:yes stop_codon:yes gene_type:complete